MDEQPTQPEALATVVGLCLHLRRLIEVVDQSDPESVAMTMRSAYEWLAVVGGGAIAIAEDLGCETEVNELVAAAMHRVKEAMDNPLSFVTHPGTIGHA